MLYKVMIQRGLKERFEMVEAVSIADAERASDGIVVALADHLVDQGRLVDSDVTIDHST